MKQLAARLEQAMKLTLELALTLSEDQLKLRIPGVPSNTIGEQLWCMVGARESYAVAISIGGWQGFGCSLTDCYNKDLVIGALSKSQVALKTLIGGILGGEAAASESTSEVQLEYLYLLLEHEVQHHGQLIRYIYANRLGFPESWHRRYTV